MYARIAWSIRPFSRWYELLNFSKTFDFWQDVKNAHDPE